MQYCSKIYPILRFCWGGQEFIDLICWWGQIFHKIVPGVSLIKQRHRKTFLRTLVGNAMMQQLIIENIHSNKCAMSTTKFPSITRETNTRLTGDVRVLEFQDIKKTSHIDLPACGCSQWQETRIKIFDVVMPCQFLIILGGQYTRDNLAELIQEPIAFAIVRYVNGVLWRNWM